MRTISQRAAAGTFSTPCYFEKKSVTLDPSYGTEVISWVPLLPSSDSPPVDLPIMCEAQDVLPSKDERVVQGLSVLSKRTRIRTHFRTDIDSSMRVRIASITARPAQIIGGPVQLGWKKGIEILVEETSS